MTQVNNPPLETYKFFSDVTTNLETKNNPSRLNILIGAIIGGPIVMPFNAIMTPISFGTSIFHTSNVAISVTEEESKILEAFDTPEKQEKIKKLLPKLRDWANKNPNYKLKVINSNSLYSKEQHMTLPNNTICFSEEMDVDGVDFCLAHEKAHVDGYHSILSVVTKIVGIVISMGIIVMIIKQMRANPERRWTIFFSRLPLYIASSAAASYADTKLYYHFLSRADAIAAKNTTESERENFYESLKIKQVKFIEDLGNIGVKIASAIAGKELPPLSFSDLSDDEQKEIKERAYKLNLHYMSGYDREQAIRAAATAA